MQGSNGAVSWSRCHLAPSLKGIGLHISRTRGAWAQAPMWAFVAGSCPPPHPICLRPTSQEGDGCALVCPDSAVSAGLGGWWRTYLASA